MPPTGRYAPSPTGSLHLGNLRTALLAWASARHAGGRFLLRVDDLDPQRSRPHWVTEQLADLRAIGIDWDGDPVHQSDRFDRYAAAIDVLAERGATYECFCTRAEIREAASAPHGELPDGAYPGTCRELTERERAERRASGRPAALRVRAGAERISFRDEVAGTSAGIVDDFVVRRNDGVPAYNLATTVDDAELGVTEVVRGADLLGSVSRQIWLARALGIAMPERWAHVPLVLGGDGERLAKRHGAVALADLAQQGVGPAEVTRGLVAGLEADPGDDPSAGLLARFTPALLRVEAAPLAQGGDPAAQGQ
ncbi:tRNA glutamyl-Q(34) synthetase GluQRS [Thermoleophilia bacterium SCSIO 60948]|nr:tRNA glutamyl-Q(34) synthetase GluQRS [Thermoleophilia bacterium SCSIO 60948]